MRVLFLTSRLPFPPDRGDRLRTYHLLRHFSREHQVTLVSFVTSRAESERRGKLAPFCEDIHLVLRPPWRSQLTSAANIWRQQPLQALYYRSSAMQRLVDRLLSQGNYDVIYVHLFRMAPYAAAHPQVFRVVDLTDLVSLEIAASLPYRSAASRLIYRLELPRISRYERQVAAWAEETWLINERERALLAGRSPRANVQLVPNGVDLQRFHPLQQTAFQPHLLFVGHLDVFHNIDAAVFLLEEIFPRVRRQLPGCTLRITGPGTGVPVSRWAADPAVAFGGFVPDLNRALNDAAVFVAPLRFSAGLQNKVLEAMAAGTPVVTTSNVNAGLSARAGRDLLVGESADELAQAILMLLSDEAQRRQIGEAGRRFVSGRFSWQVARDRLQQIEMALP